MTSVHWSVKKFKLHFYSIFKDRQIIAKMQAMIMQIYILQVILGNMVVINRIWRLQVWL